MELLVERITGAASAHHFTASAAWREQHLALSPSPAAAAAGTGAPATQKRAQGDTPEVEALEVALEASRRGDDLLLEGRVSAATRLLCGRCLVRFSAPLSERFRLLLEPAGERTPTDPDATAALKADGLCLDDTFATGWYRGTEIRLNRFVAETVLLALPLQPLCHAACRGLCPGCGVDLERAAAACRCPAAPNRSPFAKLAPLRGALAKKPERETESGGPR